MGKLLKAMIVTLLAALLFRAVDQIRRSERRRQRSASAALLHHQAIEVNDSLVQSMVAARWALESGRLEDGLSILDDTIAHGLNLVSTLLRTSGMGARSEPLGETGSNVPRRRDRGRCPRSASHPTLEE